VKRYLVISSNWRLELRYFDTVLAVSEEEAGAFIWEYRRNIDEEPLVLSIKALTLFLRGLKELPTTKIEAHMEKIKKEAIS